MAERTFTDLELERALANDLPAPRMRELETSATDADRARLDELRAENQAFLAQVDVDAEVRAIGRRMEKLPPEPRPLATWWRWLVTGGALAAAAAAILIVVTRRPHGPGSDDDIGVKGDGVALILHAQARQLASGDVVAPGEKLRFEINAGKRGYVAVIGLDGSGATTVYYPFGGVSPAPIDPKETRVLPGAIQLDATPGDETFLAVYSERPFSIAAVMPAIRGANLPAGISSAEVVLHKQPR